MPTLDQIFEREFREMCQLRRGHSGQLSLYSLPIPESFRNEVTKVTRKVIILGIKDEYYQQLNRSEVRLWVRPKLKRRRFDSNGEFLRDKATGKYIADDVPLTQGCVAIISEKNLKVPLKYKPSEPFAYIDYMQKENTARKYVYVIPKDYCYNINQLALVISLTRLKNFYYGQELTLQSGHIIYLYVIEVKPTSMEKAYRILKIKTTNNFTNEINELTSFWLNNNILFPAELTQLGEPVRGISNVAYKVLSDTKDEFVRFDPNRPLSADGESMDGEFEI